MQNARSEGRPVLRLLLGAACLLVVLLALEYHFGVSREPGSNRSIPPAARGVPSERTHATAALVPDAATADRETEVILARPLFTQSRRPAAVAVAGPSEPRLAGIIIGPNGRRAIFAGEGDARGTVAAAGQDAGSWKVLAIEPNAVRVSGPDGVRVLRPSRGAGTGDGDAASAGTQPALPAHPSILDLLRARPAPFGATPGPAVPVPSPAAAAAAMGANPQ